MSTMFAMFLPNQYYTIDYLSYITYTNFQTGMNYMVFYGSYGDFLMGNI